MSEPDKVPETNLSADILGGFFPTQPPSIDRTGFQPPSKIDLKEHEATTARTLTYVVVGMLGVSIIVQYGAIALLVANNRNDAIPIFEHLFNTVLPVLAGLTGSAVVYYLTKEKK